MALLTEEEQEEAMKKGIEAIQNVCGVTPVGFRAPEGGTYLRYSPNCKEIWNALFQ